MYLQSSSIKSPPVVPSAGASRRLLDQVRDLHYSLRTERAYVYWVRALVHVLGIRHPREMREPEVDALPFWLAGARRVAVARLKQTLSALLFPHQRVFGAGDSLVASAARQLTYPRPP